MTTINGTAGNDTLFGTVDDDAIDGLAGNDSLKGGNGHDTVTGGLGNDWLSGGLNNDALIGEAGNDTLEGGDGNDALKGGAGNDVYLVDNFDDIVDEGIGGGKDTIRATGSYKLNDGHEIESFILDSSVLPIIGSGNGYGNLIATVGASSAVIFGLAGNDTLMGGAVDDVLYGGAGNDILTGGNGDDYMAGEAGKDTMTGGKGNDNYSVSSAGGKVVEQAGQGIDTVFSSLPSYTLSVNVENLRLDASALDGTGNALNNSIEANALANKLNGSAGNDMLFGKVGNDTLGGGTGNDSLFGGTGADSMTGGAGNDFYVRDEAGDAITELAGGGIDTMQSDLDGQVLAANVENLMLTGVAAISGTGNRLNNVLVGNGIGNVLVADAGNDTLEGGDGNDTLKGGAGNDVYLVDNFDDIVDEGIGGGKDTIRATGSYKLNDGHEIESFILDSSVLPIIGSGNGYGNLIATVGASSAVIFGLAGNDTLMGGAVDDVLYGGAGNDILTGGNGDDYMAGEAGKDTMTGGKGNDNYSVSSAGGKVVEQAGQGIDTVFSSLPSYTLSVNVENLRLDASALDGTGNALNNTLFGNTLGNDLNGAAGNDSLTGAAGADTLTGGAGADTLNGGSDNDKMTGGAGNDVYVWEDSKDLIIELAGGGIDTVQTDRDGHVLAANVENLTMTGFAAVSGTGNALNNALIGNAFGNVLSGEAGNDTLDGGAGNDTLKGGTGNDVYLVDSLSDVVEEGIGGGKDTIRATFTYQLNDGQEIESFILDSSLVIGGFGNSQGNLITMVGTGLAVMVGNGGNDTLTGGAGDDALQGDAGKDILSGGGGIDVLVGGDDGDTLKGGAGDDVLVGGLGADALFGEAGNDWFSYRIDSVPELATLGNDKIAGFQKGVDKIDLRDLIADFGINADDAIAGKFVILSKAGANTIVQFDQDGSGGGLGPVTLATVTSATVTAADLVLEIS